MPSKKMQAAGRKAWKTRQRNLLKNKVIASVLKFSPQGILLHLTIPPIAGNITINKFAKKTRKQVDWVAAGKKAWRTRRKNGNA